jgi:hypothetical protein
MGRSAANRNQETVMERDPQLPSPDDDEASASEPIEPENYGQIVEICAQDDVDGDFNGAPELAGLEESRKWTAVDVLDAMRGGDAEEVNRSDDAPLAERVALLEQERSELVDRLDDLRTKLEIDPDTAAVAEELAHKIRRLDEALAKFANEGGGESV